MTNIGFLGAGLMTTKVAKLATAAGLDVLLSNSRGPQSLIDLATELDRGPRPSTPQPPPTQTSSC